MNCVQVPDSSTIAGNGWRAQTRDLLGEILFPEKVRWMEDDDTMNDHEYKQRVLGDIRDKYDKYVFTTQTLLIAF